MSQPSVPLSMLLTRDVAYEWHDGVALAAQLVDQVRSDIPQAQERIPDLRAVTLEANGRLTLVAHPDLAMPAMPGAPQILQQLLSGKDQPAPLRLFAMQAATAEPTPTLEWFAEELAKWERPGRQAKLASLYFRALEQIGPAALTEEARAREERELTKKPAAVAAAAAKKPKKPSPPRDASRSSSSAVAIVVILAALVVGGVAWYTLQRSVPGVPPAAGTTENASTEGPGEPAPSPDSDRPATRRAAAARRPPTVANAEAELARARELFQRQEYSAANVAFDRVIEILGTESAPQAEELRQVARSLAEVSRAAVAEQAEAAAREYRAGEAGVSEPVPLAYLPPKPDPDTPADRLQVLEVHINTSGTVDSVKFVMNRPSFRNSWWISAAKAWRFSPAMKDGRPVRYVMRIVMDDSAAER